MKTGFLGIASRLLLITVDATIGVILFELDLMQWGMVRFSVSVSHPSAARAAAIIKSLSSFSSLSPFPLEQEKAHIPVVTKS